VVQTKASLPAGPEDLLARPEFAAWPALAASNHLAAEAWSFEVAGTPVAGFRTLARGEMLATAERFSKKLGVLVDATGGPNGLIVATGHQPELYHPGVWIKDFLLQHLADLAGATPIEIVVDSDGFDAVSVSSPCLVPEVHRCTQYLAVGSKDGCYASAAVPSAEDIDEFCEAVEGQVSTLPAPAVSRHFAVFAKALREARTGSDNLAELLTKTRRRYEGPECTRYLELATTSYSKTTAFLTFVVDLALSGERFAAAYNGALADYRAVNRIRSDAQPFPDLSEEDGRVELPLWAIVDGLRSTLWARRVADELEFSRAEGVLARVPALPAGAVAALQQAAFLIAPKALALTLFTRAFVCDLFIHGVGGGAYDRVTDDVFRRYFGIEPPAFVVASITMYLALGAHVVTDEEVSAARERLNRLDHNPDALLGEIEFDTAEERARAVLLAREKAGLVAAIGEPDADKKTLGQRIREVNGELALMLEPLKETLRAELENLQARRAASDVLTDRTYPYCFWSPSEVAEKAG
jgi:hypothetical protein